MGNSIPVKMAVLFILLSTAFGIICISKDDAVDVSEAFNIFNQSIGSNRIKSQPYTLPSLNVKLNDIIYHVEHDSFLGHGSFGFVLKAQIIKNEQTNKIPQLQNDEYVALKFQMIQTGNEIRANKILKNHPNVVQMLDASDVLVREPFDFPNSQHHMMVLELMVW